MRVLLVDDDAAIRGVIKRMLRPLELDITECQNGLEALELLAVERFAFVLLDCTMPVLDGAETLRAIRGSPSLAGLPVVMLTAVTDTETVKRLLAYGLSAYIVKPLRYTQVVERISKLIATIRDAEGPGQRSGPVFRPLEISLESSVMIADGSAEFREFFRRQISGFCTVREIDSGIAALRSCMDSPPAALFVGTELGVFSSDLLARKVVEAPTLRGTRVIGVLPANLMRRGRKGSPYEAVVLRTFVADLFLEGYEALLRRPGRLAGLLEAVPDLKLLGIGTFEGVLVAVLQREAVARAPKKSELPKSVRVGVVIRLGVERMPLQVDLVLVRRQLDKLSVLMTEAGMASSGDDPEAPLLLLLGKMAESLTHEFVNRGFEAEVGVPQSRVAGAAHSLEQQDDVISVEFDAVGTGLSFRLDLSLADEA
jgi:CheY-like chemotaxis protein